MIRTLCDRLYKINNTWKGIHDDFEKTKIILQKNMYPPSLIDRTFKNYLNSKYRTPEEKTTNNTKYFKLPYTGKYSDIVQKKIKSLSTDFCKDLNLKMVFTSFKIKQMFSTKDKLPDEIKSNVVYKFCCASCNACYIGETTRHLSKRIDEHLRTDKNSHIYKHLQGDLKCFDSSNKNCFSILDSATSTYQLKIKEGLHIQWDDPILNKQVNHYKITIN